MEEERAKALECEYRFDQKSQILSLIYGMGQCLWRGIWISSIERHSREAAASAKAAMVHKRAGEDRILVTTGLACSTKNMYAAEA